MSVVEFFFLSVQQARHAEALRELSRCGDSLRQQTAVRQATEHECARLLLLLLLRLPKLLAVAVCIYKTLLSLSFLVPTGLVRVFI